jgi:hypothetical protein
LSIILVWSVVVNVVSGGIPIFLSLGVYWLVVLSSVTTDVTSGIVGSDVDSCIDTGVNSDVSLS